jgi:hypothetical protein
MKIGEILKIATVAGAVLLAKSIYRGFGSYDLKRRVVLITGASRGLGLVLAREFAAEGARIVIAHAMKMSLSKLVLTYRIAAPKSSPSNVMSA